MFNLKWSYITVGFALLSLATTEYLINTVPSASALRLKSIPGMVALVVFIFLFAIYVYKNRPRVLPTILVFFVGLLLLVLIGIPLWLIIGCSTGPVCI
jgi:hypothetical protein